MCDIGPASCLKRSVPVRLPGSFALRKRKNLDPRIASGKVLGALYRFRGRTIANNQKLELADRLCEYRLDCKRQEDRGPRYRQQDRENGCHRTSGEDILIILKDTTVRMW